MAAIESGWTRFYGMPVPQEIAAAATESLIDTSVADLVDAHLGINYSYFGAIDKTLSGFVITDDEGDNYTLVDVRDTGQTWWQDHETRELEPRSKTVKPSRKAVTTPDLLARYQWLVWQLARPMEQDGKPIQTVDELVRNGIGRFRHIFPRKEAYEKTFAAELPALAKDPHLAIYWLLHTTALGDDAKRAKVVASIGTPDNELVRAFLDRFGTMPASGDVPIVPGWRERRALAVIYGAFALEDDEMYAAALRALELSPTTRAVQTALQVAAGIERAKLDPLTVSDVLARIAEQTTGTEFLRAIFDKRRGESSSKHADAFAALAATSDDAWWSILEALWQIHELAYDVPALQAVTSRLVVNDRYHRRALQMQVRAAQMAGESFEAYEDALALSESVLGPYTRLVEVPDTWQETIEGIIDPAVLRALAWRVLQRVELNKPTGELAAWAAGQMVSAGDEGRALVAAAFAKLDATTQESLIQVAGKAIDRADHPLVSVLLAFLDGPEPAESDFGAMFALKRGKEAAIQALAPWFADKRVFDPIVKALERPAGRTYVELVIGKLFSPFEKPTYVLHKLDNQQAIRVAKAMIATRLRHPSIHARNTAGHQLYRFDHVGAEEFLIDALTEYAVKFAAEKGPAANELEDVVANLYSAVRNMKTATSRTALVERLFAERREYWRMGNAIGEIFSPEVHAEAMRLLGERKDARAAGCYAYALQRFVKKGPPLVELTRMILDWQGDNEVTRGFLHYALILGMVAALDARDYELVKRAHDAASWIADPPIEPDDHARGRGWTNPLGDPAVKARLDDVLSGKAEEAKQKLRRAAEAARKAGTPNKKVDDEALGQLADATVLDRIATDPTSGEVWFRDGEKRLRYFDGYAVVDGGFTSTAIGHEGVGPALEDAGAVSERALWWDKKADNFRDVLRLGRHVLLTWGVNNGQLERYLISFGATDAASVFTAKLRAHPPKGYTASEPYYVPGKGAVVRTYYAPKEGGGDRERRLLWLLDTAVSDEDQGDAERAVGEHLRREAVWLRGGGVMSTLEHSEARRRREDMTVREWIKDRIRDDRRDARWHLAALPEIADYLHLHGLAPRQLAVALGPPASADEIAAFAASRKQPLPDSLRALWSIHRNAEWSVGKVGMRLLDPRAVEEARPKAREAGDALLEKLPPDAAARSAPLYGELDVLVEARGGRPVTFLADIARDDGRVFSHAADHPNDFWWEVSLSWMLATRLLAGFEEAVAAARPEIDTLKFGERAVGGKPAKAAKPKAKAKPAKKAPAKPAKKAPAKPAKKAPKQAPAKPAKRAATSRPKPTSKPKPKPKKKR